METVLVLSYACSAISAVVIMVGGYFLLKALTRLGTDGDGLPDEKDD